LIFAATFACSCTPPMQPVAMQAFELGVRQNRTVRSDLARIAEYEAVNATTDRATLIQKLGAIRELVVQGERADASLLFARVYIVSTKGILNILVDDWRRAADVVDDANTNGV
jgi:hypothetical protein